MTQVYTVAEIMQILSISKNHAYKFIENNPPFKVIKIGNTYRIPKQGFDDWFNKQD
jgi:excisionase family DNA binding protein